MNFKISAVPFLLGTSSYSYFSQNWDFTISCAALLTLLVLTKQVKLF